MKKRDRVVLLEFNPHDNDLGDDKELTDGLSCVVQIGKTIWVANDETLSLERLSLREEGDSGKHVHARHHKRFSLDEYLRLPESRSPNSTKVKEADIEGLAYENGYLWLIGSHSWKRTRVKKKDGANEARANLADVSQERNRYVLARIPIVERDDTHTLAKEGVWEGKKLSPAILHVTDTGNDLTDALAKDDHLSCFLKIPSKDNGFDIEGLAVVGDRVFIGLRGPVLRGWAIILEVEPKEKEDDPTTLELKKIGSEDCPYRKHFLDLGGLSVRDLYVDGPDLLILAGPTMELDGPVTLFRWPGGANPDKQGAVVRPQDLKRIMDLPYGERADHPEGITLFAQDGHEANSLLVVYDTVAKERKKDSSVEADIFRLPQGDVSRHSSWWPVLTDKLQEGIEWVRSAITGRR